MDGYSLMWMAPESVMSLLCAPDAPDAKKKAALAALEHLRSENAATQQRVSNHCRRSQARAKAVDT